MTLVRAVRDKLLGNTDLAALVGARVFPVIVPAGQGLPAVTVRRASGPTEDGLDASELGNQNVEVSAWAESYEAAVAVGEKVHAALEGWVQEVGGWNILDCRREGLPDDGADYRPDGSGECDYVVNQTYGLQIE